ncbi:N-terminal C2 in EEIG1 and EHBP1 proteins-domain-containing protein [Suillus placidus]|uniref:N-terminal C2 in EEIG1 and EHBP1 proteins-domain-containing protein n=1 Tax=Suillus placidus TaxID=48579 RepID=A0A9P7D4F7_9AGAM|nr:N-terminal C2 in EEIG1 and EHBP1 proteins-domain-containing protein [Suillus placidus]
MLLHDSRGAESSISSLSERSRTANKPCPKLHLSPPAATPRVKSLSRPHTRPASPTAHSSGFRAQLAHLLPRHAIFLLRLTIHQLSSVPLVNGEFEVRWKFKGVTSGGGLLGKVKGKCKAKGNELDPVAVDTSDAQSTTNSNLSHSHDPSIPSVVVSANSSGSTSNTFTVSTPSTSSPHSHPQHVPPQYLSADWLPQSTPPDPSPSLAKSPPTAYAPAKGHTLFEQLKEHSVVWEQTLDVMVQMGIGRETNELGDCEAKLVVMQRVIPGDPDAPRNPRLGAVTLNLAQYVDAGVVTRRYLLRQSKTNATLKLTVQLEHISGESSYIAPPLPKGEILSGVAGLLDNDVFRTRPRTLDLYANANSSSSSVSTISTHSSGKRAPGSKRKKNPLDASQLPNTRGIRGTEKLIEALFNPAPVTRPGQLTPFTYLHEPSTQSQSHDHSREPTTEDGHVQVYGEGEYEYEARLADESLYSNSNSVDLNHHLLARMDSESDYQSMHSKWTGSLRAPSVKSTRSVAVRVNVDELGVSTAVSSTTIVEKRAWWRKVLHAGVAS